MNTIIKKSANYLTERDNIIIDLHFVNSELQSGKDFIKVLHDYFYGLSEDRKDQQEVFKVKLRYSHLITLKDGKPYIELLEI